MHFFAYHGLLAIVAIMLFNKLVQCNRDYEFMNPEGDIKTIKSSDRTVLVATGKWPNGIVPFVFDAGYNQTYKSLILNHMDTIRRETKDCVKFVSRTNEASYLKINSKTSGCSSYMGMIPKSYQPQTVDLNVPGCINQRNVIHELFHSLGFVHEQTRSDRDSYVSIKTNNIQENALDNFAKFKSKEANSLGFPYDYYSIMHYPNTAFSLNKNATIVPIDSMVNAKLIGGLFLSLADIIKVRRHYGCVPNTTKTIDIAIQSLYNNKYVVAGGVSLIANGTNPSDPSQRFTVSFNRDTTISLKSIKYGKYLSVDTTASNVLKPSKTSVATKNQKFYMISNDFVSFYLKSKANGKYVTVGANGTSSLSASVVTPKSTERFFRTIL